MALFMQLSANNNHPHQLMAFFMQLSANNHRHLPNGTFMQLSANNNHPQSKGFVTRFVMRLYLPLTVKGICYATLPTNHSQGDLLSNTGPLPGVRKSGEGNQVHREYLQELFVLFSGHGCALGAQSPTEEISLNH